MLTEIVQQSRSIDSRNVAADHGLLRMVTYRRLGSFDRLGLAGSGNPSSSTSVGSFKIGELSFLQTRGLASDIIRCFWSLINVLSLSFINMVAIWED